MYYDDDAEEKAVLADQFLLEVEYRLKQAMNGDTQSAQILLQYLARLLWDRR